MGKRNVKTCRHCGSGFFSPPSTGKVFCSRECRAQHSPAWAKHGQSGTRLHNIWCGMKSRCKGTAGERVSGYYSNRGIRVCDEWQESFDAFREWSLANGYRHDLELDRIDPRSHYEPANCRWASRIHQMSNTTKRSTAKTSRFKGVSLHSQNAGRFIAQIYSSGKTTNLGSFGTQLEAARAYDVAAVERWGEFARVNFPEAQFSRRT